ncbi:MAG: hypothetical protein ABII23_00325 [bacterium]
MKLNLDHVSTESIFISIAVLGWFTALLPLCFYKMEIPTIIIMPSRPIYYHHQFIELRARVRPSPFKRKLIQDGIPVSILKDNRIIKGIGNREVNRMQYDPKKDMWYLYWPCPWNASAGLYKPLIPQENNNAETPGIDYLAHNFTISRKALYNIPKPVSVMTYETNDTISSIHPPLISGGTGQWQNIFDWCEFTGTDVLWILGGQTAYFSEKLDIDFPWLTNNLSFLSALGKKAHTRGVQFGAYAMAYLTFGKEELKPGRYEYAIDYNYKTDSLFTTRSVSLRDVQRKKDIIEILKIFDSVDEMDYIGLDYIRNALGGYELVDEFVHEMNVDLPPYWDEMERTRRMKWMARKKVQRQDMDFIDQWQWWRAHVSASLVEEIKKEVNSSKPFWVFTLSWERGWQHGQDPVMMSDAGADIDAVMLYEADKEEYADLLKHWHTYASKTQVNLIVGDVVDWNLHQKTSNPAGPEEYFYRNIKAVDLSYTDGPAKGVFLHDLNRIMWGRRGPYSRVEWALAGAASVSYVKNQYQDNTYELSLKTNEEVSLNEDIEIFVHIKQKNLSHRLPVHGELFHSAGIVLIQRKSWEDTFDTADEITHVFRCRIVDPNLKRFGRHYVAARIEWLEGKRNKSYTAITYFSIPGFDLRDEYKSETAMSAGSSIDGYIRLTNNDQLTFQTTAQLKTAGE